MHPLETSVGGSKRRKNTDKSVRRFSPKDMKKKELIPMTTPVPKKAKSARRGVRMLGFVAIFFISLSTVSVWRRRAIIRYASQDVSSPTVGLFHDTSDESLSNRSPVSANLEITSRSHSTGSGSVAVHDSKDFDPPLFLEAHNNVETRGAPQGLAAGSDSSHLSHEKHDEDSGGPHARANSELEANAQDSRENSMSVLKQSEHITIETKRDGEDDRVDSGGNNEVKKETRDHSQSSDSSQTLPDTSTKTTDSAGGGGDSVEAQNDPVGQKEMDPIGVKEVQEEPISFEEPPERIELYTRNDFKEGMRPLCRISHPYVLSNGTILFPRWMERYSRILKRCAVGRFGFYSPDETPTYLAQVNNVDADFALTIRFERFQEPTQDESIFLTEHLLKASYLFDMFGGDGQEVDAVKEEHCYTYENDSNCSLKRPPRIGLKPAVFVPAKIMQGSRQLRSYNMVEMFGAAHGHGRGVIPLNASALLVAKHAGRSDNLIGTRFRSVLSTDGMFRHLPLNGLKAGNLFSSKNGIVKDIKAFEKDGKCALTIGIAKSNDEAGIRNAEELQSKLKLLTKFALPQASVTVELLNIRSISLEEHIKQMADIDIFLAGSGHDMNSMSFMRNSGTAFELAPFGLRPNTHESLSRVLGLGYERLNGRPQTEVFKQCIESEIFKLRKSGKIKLTEKPDWYDTLMKTWDAAVGEFATKGTTSLDVLSAPLPVRSYYSRVCAQHQAIDVNLDDTARQVILAAKAKCEGK